jgi:hypothetical protein
MHRAGSVHGAAFAEGRRLREAAEKRRRRRRHRPRMHHGPRPRFLPLIGFIVLVGAAGRADIDEVALVLLIAFVASMLPLLFTGLAIVGTSRRARGVAQRTAAPVRQAVRPKPEALWKQARDRFHGVRAEYAEFECDPMAVLRLPALADVSVPSTARFVDAFAEAQALETDAFPPAEHASAFVAAVEKVERAWRAAREAAERIRLSRLSSGERSTVERVIKLLTTARETDNDSERFAAYGRARSELAKLDRAGVIHLPRPAETALEAAARGALPA